MKGVAGIVDWAQCRRPGQPHEEGRELLLGEVSAAIDGALPTARLVKESLGRFVRIEGDDPLELYGRSSR